MEKTREEMGWWEASVGSRFVVTIDGYSGVLSKGCSFEVIAAAYPRRAMVDIELMDGSRRFGWILWKNEFAPVDNPSPVTPEEARLARPLPSPEEALAFVMRNKS